jgi:hypothetical protein
MTCGDVVHVPAHHAEFVRREFRHRGDAQVRAVRVEFHRERIFIHQLQSKLSRIECF